MRETLRPVTLKRIIEVTNLCPSESTATISDLKNSLDISENRTKEAVSEMERTSLLENDDNKLRLTEPGNRLQEGYESEDWSEVHSVLYDNSPHYHIFIDQLESNEKKHGLTADELLEELKGQREGLRFNKTGLDVITDWGERLGAIQRNVFEERYYTVLNPRDQSFVEVLQAEYSDMDVERGIGMNTRHVSIPEIRERVCERMRMTRGNFDQRLTEMYLENIGKMELSGAPIDTQAKDSRYGIKTIEKVEEAGIATSDMNTDRVLDGISLDDGKMYYYLAIFGQFMEE